MTIQGGASGASALGEDGEAIVADTAITAEDFEKAWTSLPQTRYRFKLVGVAAIAATVAVACHLLARSSRANPEPFPWAYVVAAFATPPLLGWGIWHGRVRWAKNAVNDLRSLEGVQFRFDAEGIVLKLPGRSLTWAWALATRSLETPEAFIIYLSPISLIVVPKRAFSAPDLTRLGAIFKERVPHRPLRGEKIQNRTLLIWGGLIAVFFVMYWALDH